MGCNHTVLRYLAHGPAEMFRMVGVERGRSHEDPRVTLYDVLLLLPRT